MTIENLLAEALNKAINGEKVREKIEEWRISANINGPHFLELIYANDAIYGFTIQKRDIITLNNFHREANKGTGTRSLKEFESAIALVAKKRHEQIMIIFDPYEQEDTIAWLEKNKYTKNLRRNVYFKLFN